MLNDFFKPEICPATNREFNTDELEMQEYLSEEQRNRINGRARSGIIES
jgi:hypothetical protein